MNVLRLAALATGCFAAMPAAAAGATSWVELAQYQKKLMTGCDHNRVLNQMEIGTRGSGPAIVVAPDAVGQRRRWRRGRPAPSRE